jgi:hypothetical protein
MKNKLGLALLVGAAFLFSAPARAIDVWDQSTEDDNSTGTDNGLTHGSEQLHDLGAEAAVADLDFYIFDNRARSSYEVLIDGTTGDMNLGSTDVQRLDGTGAAVQSSVGLAGYSAALRWENTTATNETNFIRVQGASCGTACSSNDQYRIRFFETTYSLPRFNNSGAQTTTILVQNQAPFTCSASFHFYNNAGTFLGTVTNAFSVRELFVQQTNNLAFATGVSGSIIVAHTCGYGGLAGKAVAVEVSTGFTFDTALVPRIN